ncbi:MAG: M48 family metallopeptidase, partial [Proteobacteria bacterium]|nr:M48 family metallopeptidase [Pseudomonadota bacterium]
MDFFKSQDDARHNTSMLVVFFILAVLSMIILTNLLVMVVFGYIDSDPMTSQPIDWEVFMTVGVGVIALVGMGSLYKIMALSGGGARIAEMMNGQLVVDDSGDPDKQRLLNVVEEMAIAAGLPVPPVYLLEEKGINAFAAGFSPSDAVIGVTRGAITKLSRDELQGVIAHEFSHILNGDMRLNIRLMGILHGILLIGLIGYHILRATPRSRNSKGGGGIVFLGLGLVVIGYAGTFFGNIIKAAVSRQREYLADAAAVQFTRNPEGIGGALMRIGAPHNSAIVTNPHSAEISHAFFCQGISASLTSFFATHPPLPDRIRKIIPTWDGTFKVGERPASPVVKAGAAGPKERLGEKNMA